MHPCKNLQKFGHVAVTHTISTEVHVVQELWKLVENFTEGVDLIGGELILNQFQLARLDLEEDGEGGDVRVFLSNEQLKHLIPLILILYTRFL